MLLQLLFVLIAIIIGARLGGIGLGVLGGLGLAILTFVFGLEPTSPPIDVMLMIVAVIAAASCMQAAGGLDLMVKWAEKLLRKNPSKITLLSPLVTYIFTFIAGTGHVAYSVLPVIAEVATETKIRPERPLGIAVIASQQAITASPISAATVALLSMLSGHNISLMDILMISVPCTLIGVLVGAFCSLHVGKELAEDPEYLRRVANEEFTSDKYRAKGVENHHAALLSVIIFIAATIGIVLFGSMTELRPWFSLPDGSLRQMQMAHIIEILMLSAAALILLVTRTDGIKAVQGSVFSAGMQAVVAIFGIAWMGDTENRWEHGGTERLDRTYRNRNAMAFRSGPVRDVHTFVQPGSNHPCHVAVRNRPRNLSLYANRPFPGSQWLLLHSQLSDRGRRHQLRPYWNDAYRQICPKPFVHDAGTGRYRSVGGVGTVDDPVVLM